MSTHEARHSVSIEVVGKELLVRLALPCPVQVMGETIEYFSKEPGALAQIIVSLDKHPERVEALGRLARARSDQLYRWDAVAAGYAELFQNFLAARRDREKYEDHLSDDVYRPGEFYVKNGGQSVQAKPQL